MPSEHLTLSLSSSTSPGKHSFICLPLKSFHKQGESCSGSLHEGLARLISLEVHECKATIACAQAMLHCDSPALGPKGKENEVEVSGVFTAR